MKNLPLKLKFLRQDANLSQAQLAELIKIPQSTIARFELGINEPRASEIRKYADFFGVCADYILGRQEWY